MTQELCSPCYVKIFVGIGDLCFTSMVTHLEGEGVYLVELPPREGILAWNREGHELRGPETVDPAAIRSMMFDLHECLEILGIVPSDLLHTALMHAKTPGFFAPRHPWHLTFKAMLAVWVATEMRIAGIELLPFNDELVGALLPIPDFDDPPTPSVLLVTVPVACEGFRGELDARVFADMGELVDEIVAPSRRPAVSLELSHMVARLQYRVAAWLGVGSWPPPASRE